VELIQLKESWNSLKKCGKLIETHPKRLAAVIAAEGGSKTY